MKNWKMLRQQDRLGFSVSGRGGGCEDRGISVISINSVSDWSTSRSGNKVNSASITSGWFQLAITSTTPRLLQCHLRNLFENLPTFCNH